MVITRGTCHLEPKKTLLSDSTFVAFFLDSLVPPRPKKGCIMWQTRSPELDDFSKRRFVFPLVTLMGHDGFDVWERRALRNARPGHVYWKFQSLKLFLMAHIHNAIWHNLSWFKDHRALKHFEQWSSEIYSRCNLTIVSATVIKVTDAKSR